MSDITLSKYSKTTIALHWLGALFLIAVFVVGSRLENFSGAEQLQMVDLHRMGGLAVGAVFLLRLVFFFAHARPAADPSWPKAQALAAKVLHLVLYIVPILLVVSGMATMIVFGGGEALSSGDVAAYEAAVRSAPSMAVHGIAAKVLMASVVLHVIAALYHQFVQKDAIMSRISLRAK